MYRLMLCASDGELLASWSIAPESEPEKYNLANPLTRDDLALAIRDEIRKAENA